MSFRKIIGKAHLLLGLTSGLLVFIISITGCIYAFQEEIQNMTQPYRFVEARNEGVLPPSEIINIAEKELPGKHIHAVMYLDQTHAAKAIFYSYEPEYYYFVYINPYSGEVLKVKDEYADFFRIVLDGHFYLWLPHEAGQIIVASATLVFFVMIISGIILWWPRNKNGRRQRFSIKWNARWRRRNYDMHNVFGFYISWIALIFVITGLVWGFEWFRNSFFAVASGGESYAEYVDPVSRPQSTSYNEPAIDIIWKRMQNEYPGAEWIEIHVPENDTSSIAANANEDASTYYKTDYRYFDQYSLQELNVDHMWGRTGEATGAEKLMRMNYDIHVGSILGLPGKILAFCASLLIASLPVTGFLVWWGRKNKKTATHAIKKEEARQEAVYIH